MFRALLRPSSGARDYDVDYRAWFAVCWKLGAVSWSSVRAAARTLLQLTAANLQHTVNQQRNDQRGNQHHSRELLMMGIVVSETC